MELLKLRKEKKISQTEIANIIKIPQTTYSSYETNRAEPDIKTLIKLADFYHTTVDYIIGRETELNNLNGIEKSKANIIKKVIQMNDYQIARTESYISGLLGD